MSAFSPTTDINPKSLILPFSYKAKDRERRSAAESALFKLFAEDPVVYELFLHCRSETPWRNSAYRFGTFVVPERIEDTEQQIHYRWSLLLGRGTFNTDIPSETAQNNCDALKETLVRDLLVEIFAYTSFEQIHRIWQGSDRIHPVCDGTQRAER